MYWQKEQLFKAFQSVPISKVYLDKISRLFILMIVLKPQQPEIFLRLKSIFIDYCCD